MWKMWSWVTKSNVRRERMGHINWRHQLSYLVPKIFASRISLVIDMKLKKLSEFYTLRILYIEPGLTGLKKNQLLGEEELIKYQDQYGEGHLLLE